MRRLLVGVALTAVVGFTGCASGSTSDKPTTRDGAGSPQASAIGRSSSSLAPRGDLDKQSTLDRCPNAMENSPATFDSAAGTYAVHIIDFPAAQTPLTFDVLQWMSGERAREAFEQETGDPNGPPNDYYVRNESTKTRAAPVAAGARVLLTHFADGAGLTLKPARVEELPAYVESVSPETFYWLTFEAGAIVEACEQWVP